MNKFFTRALMLSLFLLSLANVKASDYQVDTLYNNTNQKELASLMREREEYYFSITVSDKSVLNDINRVVSIDKVKGDSVICYANPTEYAKLLSLGYTTTLLTPPSMQEEAVMWTGGNRATYEWDSYLTYDQYVAMMEGFPSAAASGRHCELVDLGTLTTSNHRRILGIRLNNGQPDGKPKFLYSSTMHGDEVTGMILMLRLIDEFTTSNDTRILNLLDSLDIFIFPNTNPDGTYNGGNNTVNGAKRYNGNNVDLNRHFPDFDDGPHPDGASSYQNETQWMMNLAQEYLFTMAANYHGGAEVMNYPWDTYQPTHPDDAWWRLVSLEYVSKARAVYSSYMSDTYTNGITNGYAWYTITGSRQDYMNYYGQCKEITIECSTAKTPSASNLPNFWNYNHNSMLAYMEQCLRGVHGVVRDSQTNETIQGVSVVVQNHDALGSSVTSHNVGDFHRPIKGGSYTFVFSKEGYCTEYVDVTLLDGQRIDLDVYLTPSGSCAMDCYDQTTPSSAGNYVLGYVSGTNLFMPTHSSGSASTSSVVISSTDNGFSVEQGMIPSQYTLVSTGTTNQYYISYNGYYLTRSTGGYGGNKVVTWSTTQSANNRWTITSSGITQTTSGYGSSTTYYLFYNNGSFYTGTSNTNNITFYTKGSCAVAPTEEYTVIAISNYSEGGTTTGGGIYEEGQTCTVTATPATCYVFLNWTESGIVVSENQTYSFEVTADKALTANYQLVTETEAYTESSCNSYIWHGHTYTTSGTYTYETTTSAGCPLVETLYLTIKNPTTSTDVHTACDSYTWINGVTYTTSNSSATYTTTNAAGCDSVIHLNLTINNSENVTLEPVSACDSYIWHGHTYTESQTLTFDTLTVNGCPRHETLVLTINNSEEETVAETACDSYTWPANGETYSQSGSYTHTTTTPSGCSFVETLNLTINYSEAETFDVTECNVYTWYGQNYNESGVYTHDTTTALGCPRVETLNLTIPIVEASIIGNTQIEIGGETTLTAGGGVSYVWSNGETGESITVSPTENTTYSVVVTDENGCTATAETTVYVTEGIDEIANNTEVYPNPTKNVVNISAAGMQSIRLMDLQGQVVYESVVGGNNSQIDMGSLSNGQYVLQVVTRNGISSHKVVKL